MIFTGFTAGIKWKLYRIPTNDNCHINITDTEKELSHMQKINALRRLFLNLCSQTISILRTFSACQLVFYFAEFVSDFSEKIFYSLASLFWGNIFNCGFQCFSCDIIRSADNSSVLWFRRQKADCYSGCVPDIKGVFCVKADIMIDLVYGYSIPETCSKVQKRVSAAIENMTGLEVKDVNIRVAGITVNE